MVCCVSLVTLRPALLSSLQPEHDASPRVYFATSLEALWLRGVECIREAAFVVGRRSEAFCLLLLLIPVNEIGSLVDAKVGQVEQSANELGTSVEGNPEVPPQNSPPLHDDTERDLHLHSQLAQVEVKGVRLGRKALARIRRQQVVAEGLGRIPQDVVAVR